MKAAPSFLNALCALEELKRLGIVEDYAIADAMALAFWTEPIPTFDLDVLVFLAEQETPILSLGSIYKWAAVHRYSLDGEHIVVEGLPVQFLPSHNELADEAIERAATLDYEGIAVRVVRPEYLVALYLEPSARTSKRRERAAALIEAPATDQSLVQDLIHRFKLEL
jgi:hypothetical protein